MEIDKNINIKLHFDVLSTKRAIICVLQDNSFGFSD